MILTSLDYVLPGMRLAVGVRTADGLVLLGPGVELTPPYVARLRELGYTAVWVEDEETRDIQPPDPLSAPTRHGATRAIRDTFVLASERVAGSGTVAEIRSALRERRLQETFRDHPAVAGLQEQVDQVVEEVLRGAVLSGLGSIRTRDSYTFHHCLEVAVTATMIGRLAGFPRDSLRKLAVGCAVLDVGKIFLPEAILQKPGPLTAEERRQVEEHTVLGYLFVRDVLRLGLLPAHVAYQHHERQDGRGYPRQLVGTNRLETGPEVHVPGAILPLAEAAAIADFHDACLSDRPYRSAYPPDRVWQMVRERAGSHFNREMVDLFLSVLPRYPVGARVEVTGGRWKGYTGVVARLPLDVQEPPVVRLLTDPAGSRIDAVEVDCRKEEAPLRCL
jgi:HD-GYP domain-containing protein (c-di-GMP phosphodiesterase class II)